MPDELEAFERGLKAAELLRPELPAFCRKEVKTVDDIAVIGEGAEQTLKRVQIENSLARKRHVECIFWYKKQGESLDQVGGV